MLTHNITKTVRWIKRLFPASKKCGGVRTLEKSDTKKGAQKISQNRIKVRSNHWSKTKRHIHSMSLSLCSSNQLSSRNFSLRRPKSLADLALCSLNSFVNFRFAAQMCWLKFHLVAQICSRIIRLTAQIRSRTCSLRSANSFVTHLLCSSN